MPLAQYSADEHVAYITLDAPPANCYTHAMMRELDEAILTARFDPQIHVIVLRGAGGKFFCAGADITMLREADADYKYAFCLHANETLTRLEQTPKLVIAALEGHCVGGGLEVALAADIRIACAGTGRCGLPEVNLGVLPGTGGTQRLVRVLGKPQALPLMVTGELFDYEVARELGIVHEVWHCDGSEAFAAQLAAYAQRFVPPRAPGRAVGAIKRACQSGAEMSLGEGLALERELQQRLFEGADSREGIAAYLEKRSPKFSGR